MGRLVLIGGGVFPETVPFLQEAIGLSEKTDPRVLIIPTAAASDKGERGAFAIWKQLFEPLGARVDSLYLIKKAPDKKVIERKIRRANIIYVPGGDSLFMVRLWRRLGVDRILKQAYRAGTVLSGRSAGANCWCRHGVGGEPPKRGIRYYGYRRITGLGLVDVALCTHYQVRKEAFHVFLQLFGGAGIGLEDNQAIIIKDEYFKVLSLKEGVQAYKVYLREVHSEKMPTYTELCEEGLDASGEMQALDKILKI